MNPLFHRASLALLSLGLCAGAIVAAGSSPVDPARSASSRPFASGPPLTSSLLFASTQGVRTSLRTNSAQFPAGPAEPLSASIEAPFKAIHGLTDLIVTRRELDAAKLPALLASLRTQSGVVPGPGQIAAVVMYCGPDLAVPMTGELDSVYGVSIVRQFGVGQERHELYRHDAATDLYLEEPELSMPLDGALGTDDLLLLNFGCVPAGAAGGPAERSRIELLLPPPPTPFVDAWPNGESAVELRLAMLDSSDFRTGVNMIASSGEHLYSELGQTAPAGGVKCSAIPFCGGFPAFTRCVLTWGGLKCHFEPEIVGCAIQTLNRILDLFPFFQPGAQLQPLALPWEFRDSFLSQSDRGRKYITWYYKLSAILEIEPWEAPAYVDLLNKAAGAMEVLLDENSSAVVIDQDLANVTLAVLALQKAKITHVGMLAILDQVESDLMLFTGLNRAEFVLLFNG